MSEIRISTRYALSLFDLAIEQKNLDQVHSDMKLFVDTCHTNHELEVRVKVNLNLN